MRAHYPTKSKGRKADPASNSRPEFWIYQSEIQAMCLTTAQFPDIETGGLLFGAYNGEGMATVAAMTPPSVNADHTTYNFQEDVQHANQCCHFFLDHFGLFPVGRYHSHHQLSLNSPSDGDIETASSWIRRGKFPCFLEIILTIKEGKVQLNPWVYRHAGQPELASVYSVDRPSPIRMASVDKTVYPINQRNFYFPEDNMFISGQQEKKEEKGEWRKLIRKEIDLLPKQVAEKMKIVPDGAKVILSFPLPNKYTGIVLCEIGPPLTFPCVLLQDPEEDDPKDVSSLYEDSESLNVIYENLNKRVSIAHPTETSATESKGSEIADESTSRDPGVSNLIFMYQKLFSLIQQVRFSYKDHEELIEKSNKSKEEED
jgi:hypothetical protein